MNRSHKTTAAEHRAWAEGARREGFGRRPRGRSRSEFVATEFLPDDEIPFGNERGSANMPGVPQEAREQLDRMLDAHGLPKILRTLRELCDERKPHECGHFEAFAPEAAEVDAERHADELETLLLRLARRVEG